MQNYNRLPFAFLNIGLPGKQGKKIETRVSFDCLKSEASYSNKARVKVYNLSPDTLAFVERNNLVMQLFAGYNEKAEVLFTGDVDEIKTVYSNGDVITEITSGDGEISLSATLDFNLAKGSSYQEILNLCAKSFAVPLGTIRGLPDNSLKRSYTYAGKAKDLLDTLAIKYQLKWSIQNGILQVIPASDGLKTEAIVLNYQSGLLDGLFKKEKTISGKSLLHPGMIPGRIIKITSKRYQGIIDSISGKSTGQATFKASEVRHRGDTGGGAWESEFKAEYIR